MYSKQLSRRELVALGAAFLPAALAGQDAVFSTGVSVVNVLVSVRDKDGKVVRDLTQTDFKLDEDGRRQSIKYFSQQSDLGLTLGMMVDTSGSQRFVLEEERIASLQFLRSVMREDKDMAFVLHFDGEVELLQDLTSSRKKLEAALQREELDAPRPRRRQPGGWGGRGPLGGRGPVPSRGAPGTALYDSILLASDELMRKQPGRKALILLTDGVDEGSRVTLSHAIEAAQRADTLVYSVLFAGVGYGAPVRIVFGPIGSPPIAAAPTRSNGGRVLQRIARETGGGYFEVSNKMPLDRIYARIEEELRNQYNLGYTPEGGKQGYRKIKVTMAQKGLTVQAREGYYPDDVP